MFYFMTVINGLDLSGVTRGNLHGMSIQEYYDLLEYQNFQCPLSGNPFRYDALKRKYLDINNKAPPVDHDHATGFIRGILSEKLNWLERQWELGSYGHLSKPQELTDYQNNPPAFNAIGRVQFV